MRQANAGDGAMPKAKCYCFIAGGTGSHLEDCPNRSGATREAYNVTRDNTNYHLSIFGPNFERVGPSWPSDLARFAYSIKDALNLEHSRLLLRVKALEAALNFIAYKPLGKADATFQKSSAYIVEIARVALGEKADECAVVIAKDYSDHLESHCSRDEAGIVDAFDECECVEWAFARLALASKAVAK